MVCADRRVGMNALAEALGFDDKHWRWAKPPVVNTIHGNRKEEVVLLLRRRTP
jgi:hypothetical protein